MCAREWDGGWEGKQRLGLTYGAGIERVCPQLRRAPTRNPFGLRASRARIGKGVGGGGGGDYIASEGALIRQGLKGIEEGSNPGRRFPVRGVTV
jgi:hypothetical protein